ASFRVCEADGGGLCKGAAIRPGRISPAMSPTDGDGATGDAGACHRGQPPLQRDRARGKTTIAEAGLRRMTWNASGAARALLRQIGYQGSARMAVLRSRY